MTNALSPCHVFLSREQRYIQAYLVQRPCRITGHRKVGVQGKVRDILGGGPNVGGRLDLAEALAHEEDTVNQEAIGRTLDLEVAEEGIGTKERQSLVQDVVAIRFRVGRLVGG